MTRYDKESVLKSEIALEILNYISENEEANCTEIADFYGRNRTVVSEIVSVLEEMGVVTKSKRTKAQYYSRSNNYQELRDFMNEYQTLQKKAESIFDQVKEMTEISE